MCSYQTLWQLHSDLRDFNVGVCDISKNPDTGLFTQQTFCFSYNALVTANKTPITTMSIASAWGLCFCCRHINRKITHSLQMEIFPDFLHFQATLCFQMRSLLGWVPFKYSAYKSVLFLHLPLRIFSSSKTFLLGSHFDEVLLSVDHTLRFRGSDLMCKVSCWNPTGSHSQYNSKVS